MLADGMRKLNGGLVVIASASGWPLTTVGDGTCAVFVGDRPVALCSESENVGEVAGAIQMTLGAITDSKAVVLDRGDILDTSNRAGLVAAVNRVASKTKMAVLLCSTGTPQADAPWQQVSHRKRGNGMTSCKCNQCKKCPNDAKRQVMVRMVTGRDCATQGRWWHEFRGLATFR